MRVIRRMLLLFANWCDKIDNSSGNVKHTAFGCMQGKYVGTRGRQKAKEKTC
jgi:hypothetical protein